ncbi:hypothetical protein phytr_5490 [Candidatus Phycorickettsia trachydisci]|uniref:Uncharacterized protein n=1 Tax=Candidatus Phycorickettsia trachydisci TaxID=2115978 RepID=A0A2P1P8B1_9RICK|nr:hypothetical protein [Candidatus Phycorickettsia trachydisci]AVP87494.1 hypothetical protein phytr_5490 [Candidatus Phycorickettsia trachydisci]
MISYLSLKDSSTYLNTAFLFVSYNTTTLLYDKRISKLKAKNLMKEYSQLEKMKLINNSLCFITAVNHIVNLLKQGPESKGDHAHGIALVTNAVMVKDLFYEIMNYVSKEIKEIRSEVEEIPVAEVVLTESAVEGVSSGGDVGVMNVGEESKNLE